MTVDHVTVNKSNFERVVVLKAKNVSKYLPILIGPTEADSIALKLQGQELPRPMTHDLMDSMIRDLGAKIIRVVVSEMKGEMFLAKVVLQKDDTTIESDSRPSDAIALAVRTGSPIYAEEDVLDQAGIDFDPETGEPTPANTQWPTVSVIEGPKPLSERTQNVLRRADEEARRLWHENVEPEDILLAIISEAEGVGAKVLASLGVDLQAVQPRLQEEAERGRSPSD
jgi:bifunctional DNase/RNase